MSSASDLTQLQEDTSIQPLPGDFSTYIKDDTLYIPQQLAAIAKIQNIFNPHALYGYVEAFPTSVANCLNWSLEDVKVATVLLGGQIGQMDHPSHEPESIRVYGFGS